MRLFYGCAGFVIAIAGYAPAQAQEPPRPSPSSPIPSTAPTPAPLPASGFEAPASTEAAIDAPRPVAPNTPARRAATALPALPPLPSPSSPPIAPAANPPRPAASRPLADIVAHRRDVITYRVSIHHINDTANNWRTVLHDQLRLATRRDGLAVWTLPKSALKTLDAAAVGNVAGTAVSASENAAATMYDRTPTTYVADVEMIAGKPSTAEPGVIPVAYKPVVDTIDTGYALRLSGRSIDQGTLINVAYEGKTCKLIPKVFDPNRRATSHGEAKFQRIVATYQVPETNVLKFDGEWLVPHDHVLVIPIGKTYVPVAGLVGGAAETNVDEKLDVERVMIIEVESNSVVAPPAAAPAPNFVPAPMPPTPSVQPPIPTPAPTAPAPPHLKSAAVATASVTIAATHPSVPAAPGQEPNFALSECLRELKTGIQANLAAKRAAKPAACDHDAACCDIDDDAVSDEMPPLPTIWPGSLTMPTRVLPKSVTMFEPKINFHKDAEGRQRIDVDFEPTASFAVQRPTASPQAAHIQASPTHSDPAVAQAGHTIVGQAGNTIVVRPPQPAASKSDDAAHAGEPADSVVRIPVGDRVTIEIRTVVTPKSSQ